MRTISRYLGIAAVIAMLTAPAQAMAADAGTPIDVTTFPDPVLRAYVQQHADLNHDNALSAIEADLFVDIQLAKTPSDPDSVKVHNAKGIEYFPNLRNLNLYSNNLSSIDLSHNPKLQSVSLCNSHNLTKVDLSHNPDLWFFAANMAGLTSLDVSHNPKLQTLNVAGNHLSSLDLSPYANITSSWIDYNPLLALKAGSGITFTNDQNKDRQPVQGWDPYERGYELSYPKSGSVDMRTLVPWFDATKVSDVKGATLSGTTLKDLTSTVTYTYAIGNGQVLHAKIDVTNIPAVVTYDGNGATGGSTAAQKLDQYMPYFNVAQNGFTRGGYTFVNWNTAKDGNGTAYEPGDMAGANGSMTLYAQWKKVEQNTSKPSAPDTGKPDNSGNDSDTGKPGNSGGNSESAVISFRDVNSKTPHVSDIKWLATEGISTGWKEQDGTYTFRGMNAVVRQDMAAFLYRLAGSPTFDASKAKNPFRDVTSKTPHYKEILWLASTGVTTGWTEKDGSKTFRGMNAVKRQDMAAFLHRLANHMKLKPALGKSVSFKDVNVLTPHAADIAWLARTGVTTGWTEKDGSKTFRGTNSVVRQDMAAFLHRLAELGKGGSDNTDATPSDVYYKNCAEVKAAGKAPLHRGQPGYRPGLDRDGDGVACE
ncbi:serine protease, subtilase family [Bifidobacterium ramosum]|uniref:Serine protease, subtilase family n=1 Tax=Bifidobacterium ramosum TaxID=1798158 RepID=A0A6L4X110_9BIFI|nr:serine protease, subtilase family [Bifidobacterium ramosum]NEG71816.1 hypothetical protein [Bifidobacterium ramosum]